MEYRYIKAFLLTAQHSSFSKAAEALNIAQSAVSRQIKLLEENLGEELIIRSSKKVLLTDKGQELYLATTHFDKVAMDIFEKEDKRPVKIGILHGLLKNWFQPIIIKFYKKYNRSMDIHIAQIGQLKDGIEKGEFDIVFSTENIQSELISSLNLFEENLVLISKEAVSKNKLHNHRWIVYSKEDNLFRLSKKKSDSIITVDSITTVVNLVKNNVGIAVVPDHILKKKESLVVTQLNLERPHIYMTTLNYKRMPTHIKEIADLVKETC